MRTEQEIADACQRIGLYYGRHHNCCLSEQQSALLCGIINAFMWIQGDERSILPTVLRDITPLNPERN